MLTLYGLAENLHMTVARLMDEMDEAELVGWILFGKYREQERESARAKAKRHG